MSDLINGRNISKADQIFELLGAIDELNAFIGLAICVIPDEQIKADLLTIQIIYSEIMADISGLESDSLCELKISESLRWLEERIGLVGDEVTLPDNFTFPGATEVGARLDICRTFARRVERIAVNLGAESTPHIKRYYPFLNRISSYFYLLRLRFDEAK